METEQNVAAVILSTDTSHKITQEVYEQINQASSDDYILLPDWTSFKKSAVMEILPLDQFEKQHPAKNIDYHQPYQDLNKFPALGYSGIAKLADTLVKMERFVKGLKIAKANAESQGFKTPNIDKYIQEARISYANLKAGRPYSKTERTYNPKYVSDEHSTGYEKAKLAKAI